MTPEERRRKRLQEIGRKLSDGEDHSYSKLLAWGAILWGCRVERVQEYISLLVMGELVQVNQDKDRITWVGGGDAA